MNKTHVASDLDSNIKTCNFDINVTNAKSLNVSNANASCIFCRKSMMFGTHDHCVANSLLLRARKHTNGILSRPTIASKSALGKELTVVSKPVLSDPIAINTSPKKMASPSAVSKTKDQSSWIWLKWLQHTPSFKWLPKHMCASNVTEPIDHTGSKFTTIPSSSSSYDNGDPNRTLDC